MVSTKIFWTQSNHKNKLHVVRLFNHLIRFVSFSIVFPIVAVLCPSGQVMRRHSLTFRPPAPVVCLARNLNLNRALHLYQPGFSSHSAILIQNRLAEYSATIQKTGLAEYSVTLHKIGLAEYSATLHKTGFTEHSTYSK